MNRFIYICPCVRAEKRQCSEPKCFHFTSNKEGQKPCGLCEYLGKSSAVYMSDVKRWKDHIAMERGT